MKRILLCTGEDTCQACIANKATFPCWTFGAAAVKLRNKLRIATANGVWVHDDPKGQPYIRQVPSAMIDVWSINRWLRWTGFRIFVCAGILGTKEDQSDRVPAKIGIGFWGWSDLPWPWR